MNMILKAKKEYETLDKLFDSFSKFDGIKVTKEKRVISFN